MKQIKQTSYETESGTTFITTYPKGMFIKHFEEVHATHITSWRKMMNLFNNK